MGHLPQPHRSQCGEHELHCTNAQTRPQTIMLCCLQTSLSPGALCICCRGLPRRTMYVERVGARLDMDHNVILAVKKLATDLVNAGQHYFEHPVYVFNYHPASG